MGIIFLLMIILSQIVSSLEISEVELNPAGNDVGFEWIEFYSKEEVDIIGWKIKNLDGQQIIFNESIKIKGYYSYVINRQWLDNANESVFLYDPEDNLIGKTSVLEDSKNNDFTWNNCEGKWIFSSGTKNSKNVCPSPSEEVEDEPEDDSSSDDSENEEDKKDEEKKENEEEIKLTSSEKIIEENYNNESLGKKVIKLNPDSKDIKSAENSQVPAIGLAKLGLVGFCALLAVLYLLKTKIDKKKNEIC